MAWYGLYHPSSAKYVSNIVYDLKGNHHRFYLSDDLQHIWTWTSRKTAEAELKKLFSDPENAPLVAKEIKEIV